MTISWACTVSHFTLNASGEWRIIIYMLNAVWVNLHVFSGLFQTGCVSRAYFFKQIRAFTLLTKAARSRSAKIVSHQSLFLLCCSCWIKATVHCSWSKWRWWLNHSIEVDFRSLYGSSFSMLYDLWPLLSILLWAYSCRPWLCLATCSLTSSSSHLTDYAKHWCGFQRISLHDMTKVWEPLLGDFSLQRYLCFDLL